VLMDATSRGWAAHGWSTFSRAEGLVPLVILLVLGAISIALTQLAFGLGSIGASFPANLAADPVLAVILGAVLLHEHIPLSVGHLLAYLLCLVAIVWGSIRLAAEPERQQTGT
jgi:hypothetical protein